MYCKNCGKEINDNDVVCEYCGASVRAHGKRTNTIAIVGFIMSFFIPIVGLICSIIGLKKANECESGKGLAIAGIIISAVTMVVNFILISVLQKQVLQAQLLSLLLK